MLLVYSIVRKLIGIIILKKKKMKKMMTRNSYDDFSCEETKVPMNP